MRFRLYAALAACLFAFPAWADCSSLTPWGAPTLTVARPITPLCHTAYETAVDNERLVPDWVVWTVSPERAIGCLGRTNNFAADPLLTGKRALPKDYNKSGYDQGHFAPAQDFSYSAATETESFYMSNMSPQLPELNRQGWEQVEAQTREWARSGLYGTLYVIDGPIFSATPKTIGADGVAIPDSYWKIIISPTSAKALAFVMPNKKVTKAQADTEVVSISDVERQAGIMIPVPAGIDKQHVALAWPADLNAYAKAKKAACAK